MSQSNTMGSMEQIVDKYADMVYRIAFTHMKNKTDADDIFQEVFLKLCKAKVDFDSDEHIKAWLIRVTINTCKSTFASPWKKKMAEMPEEIGAYEDKLEDFEVSDAVRSLPPKYRDVIHLFYFEDMKIVEIAKILNSTVSTVKSQLSRGRSILREKLEGGVYNV
ncbi:MAG: sigma-70 family RNA polymerase sigma factor [Defluviitaleaceae bacterium]|nr:sigma-70 family RNA polymerase sigma factor [Defluviitaleaceae bacterium]